MIRAILLLILLAATASNAAEKYNRDDWPLWIDKDGDCQNTRHEILIKTSQTKVTFKNEKECAVKSGKWLDPYTGETVTDASKIDIDHIVPLSEAHKKGGAKWNAETKKQFANDPLNLVATENRINRQKSDKAPHQWKPPNKQYHCEYAHRWRIIKDKYRLEYEYEEMIALIIMC